MRRIVPFSVFVLSACAVLQPTTKGGVRLDAAEREKVTRQYVGREFVLASSLWVSDFFGSKDELFADARPFDIIELERQSGEAVATSLPMSEVVPAGTPVKVREIIFPTQSLVPGNDDPRLANRQAPNGHPWVVVERTDKAGLPLILVLPKKIEGEAAFVAELQKRLASQTWLSSWLASTNPTHTAKVFMKQVEAGMSRAAMIAALGEPRNAAAEAEAGGLDFVADYGDLQITITGSMVSKVVSQKAEADKARREAEEKAAIARAEAEAKARAEAEAQAKLQAERELEAKKRAIEDENRRKQDEAAARIAAAKAAKEAAERERVARIAEAKNAAAVAKAEAEAAEARKKADIEAAKAEAEAAKARAGADAAAAKAEAEAAVARRHLEEKVAVAEREAEAARRRAMVETQNAEARRQENQAAQAAAAPVPAGPRKVGVKLAALTKESAFDLKLTQLEGAHVVSTNPGGPAEAAGVRANDVVLSVDGKVVRKPEDFTTLVGTTPRDQAIKLSVWRDGAKATVIIPSELAPQAKAPAKGKSGTPAASEPLIEPTASTEPPRKDLMPARRSGEKSKAELR